VKGDSLTPFPLKFVRIEPFVIPKQSLTGASTERVDTRVLQVIYELPVPEGKQLYVGQQVDVMIGGQKPPQS
jgi:HlyD family secretion protein